jgi:hypothetical protein
MEALIVEQLDRSRYKAIKWFTVGWGMWLGLYLFMYLAVNPVFKTILLVVGLAGWIIWTINLIKVYRLGKIMNADETLRNALNDENHQQNIHKSFVAGYAVTLATIAILMVIAAFFKVSATLALFISLYIGVLSVLLASLFYNRES